MNIESNVPAEPDLGSMPVEGEEFIVTAGDSLPKGVIVAGEEAVKDAFRTVFDPEIPVNIVELGLIYDLDIQENNDVSIKMTLTAPGCGMGPVLTEEVDRKVSGLKESNNVKVELVWEPQWNRDMMSEEAQLELGML